MSDSQPAPVERPSENDTGRVEAFSDGVMAVIITLMVLELQLPHGGTFSALRHRFPELLIYVLSFVFIGIYWNNHHHLLRATTRVSAWVMWTNLHLLFWLSLIPFMTAWIGASYQSSAPAATYSAVALAAGLAYSLLVSAIVRTEGRDSKVARALGSDIKGRLSTAIYAVSIGLAFITPWISYALLASVSVMWFIPDRRLAE